MKKYAFLVFCLFLCSVKIAAKEDSSEHFLSFIIPCFNCSKTVAKSIDSIYEQNIEIPFEVICTDDTSTDDTVDVLLAYEKKYSNFHVYFHEKNLGGGAASNTCVKHAQGDLLFRLDSDNVLSPGSINQLVNLLDATGCDGATVEELRYHCGDFNKVAEWIYKAPNNICDLKHCISTTIDPAASGNYLFTRKSYNKAGGYPSTRSGTDTFCFGFKQYATGSKIAILPNSFYWHFRNPQGYWSREEATGNNNRVALATLLEFHEVFSAESIDFLKSNGNYATAINNGHLKTVSPMILDLLFQGYEFEESKQYAMALKAFKTAKAYGANSAKISQKIEKLKALLNFKKNAID